MKKFYIKEVIPAPKGLQAYYAGLLDEKGKRSIKDDCLLDVMCFAIVDIPHKAMGSITEIKAMVQSKSGNIVPADFIESYLGLIRPERSNP